IPIHVCFFPFTPSFALIHERWIYASTLAYTVDENTGRSSTAVATNASFRGLFAFVATEIAVPLQYWRRWFAYHLGGVDAITNCIILLVLYKGRTWTEASAEREKRKLDGK
ncbi:uncharacterized protein F5147DRAFT_708214, partial [Suillus discolor]